MEHRKLISSRESVPAECQHKQPCTDCPWSRDALPGWLGSMTAEEWLAAVHGEAIIECHVLTGVQCAGASIYRANVAKTPRTRSILRLPANHVRVFSTPAEFRKHHLKKTPVKVYYHRTKLPGMPASPDAVVIGGNSDANLGDLKRRIDNCEVNKVHLVTPNVCTGWRIEVERRVQFLAGDLPNDPDVVQASNRILGTA